MWSNDNSAVFRLATEYEIRGPVLENAKRLLPLRRAPVDPKVAVRVLRTVALLAMPTFGRVVEALPADRSLILLPLRRTSQLAKPALAQKILSAADGILGEVVAIVTRAAARAVTSASENLAVADWARMGYVDKMRMTRTVLELELDGQERLLSQRSTRQ